jgi:glycine betaine/proline transport system ATP-binding protein
MESGRIIQIGTPEKIVASPVDDYVRQFVASVNPLKVLRCASLMRPVSGLRELPEADRAFVLDAKGTCVCHLDPNGRPLRVTLGEDVLNLVQITADLDISNVESGTIIIAGVQTPMKTIVEINHSTGLPVPVIDGGGKVVGVVGTPEIFRAILRENRK